MHWKNWCWSWNSKTLATWCEELTPWKRHAGKDWRLEEKGTTEGKMVLWHHWLDGHEFEQAPGVGDGQGSLACCSPCVCKESDMTERLNWAESTGGWAGETLGITVMEFHQRWGKRHELDSACRRLSWRAFPGGKSQRRGSQLWKQIKWKLNK